MECIRYPDKHNLISAEAVCALGWPWKLCCITISRLNKSFVAVVKTSASRLDINHYCDCTCVINHLQYISYMQILSHNTTVCPWWHRYQSVVSKAHMCATDYTTPRYTSYYHLISDAILKAIAMRQVIHHWLTVGKTVCIKMCYSTVW